VEFQIDRYAVNFLDCVDRFIPEARVDRVNLTIGFRDRIVQVGAFPISIDVERFQQMAGSAEAEVRVAPLRERYAKGSRQLGVCVDRIDYTKGIPERIRALETLWAESPELQERFTFIFVCTPSRTELPAYHLLERDVTNAIIAINERFGNSQWTPIVLINENVDADLLAAVYRAGDLCIVSSLQDGMNLVAKEFVASQLDERGVLILSRFTGSAEEIDGAVLINPFNVDGFVEAIRQALEMSPDERRRRMHRMRRHLYHSNIFDWLESILSRATQIMANDARELSAAV
jgi:trehalose 6-phosphate synthase